MEKMRVLLFSLAFLASLKVFHAGLCRAPPAVTTQTSKRRPQEGKKLLDKEVLNDLYGFKHYKDNQQAWRSTGDAIATTVHLALNPLDNKDSYVRMLLDFSSAFNTIIPPHLIEKLNLLGLNTSLCNWILDLLTGRPQSVQIGNTISSTTTLSTGSLQGCVLGPLLFSLVTQSVLVALCVVRRSLLSCCVLCDCVLFCFV